jgi:hypothetical protein
MPARLACLAREAVTCCRTSADSPPGSCGAGAPAEGTTSQTELDEGPEKVRLWAAYSGGSQLQRVIGIVGIAVAIVGTAIYGLTGTLAGGGVIGISLVIGAIAAVRSVQSEIARKEYQRTRPFTPQ